jgi:23S rRNA pseudouridine955/2504/2580 synthase
MRYIDVTSELSSMRLDRLLKLECKITHSAICSFLRYGDILINGEVSNIAYRVKIGDRVSISSIVGTSDKVMKTDEYPRSYLERIKQMVIHENDDIIVINKTFGVAVQGGSGVDKSLDKALNQIYERQIYVVHRLDADTSGVMIFAKNRQSAQELSSYFRDHAIEKYYISINAGVLDRLSGMTKTEDMVTNFNVIESKNNISCILFNPITGKKHQIRKHSLEMKCPIIGDDKYGYDKTKEISKKLHLCAFCIKIPKHGVFTLKILPNHILKTLDNLEFNRDDIINKVNAYIEGQIT